MIVDRIEVYLDQGTEPVAVLKEPPIGGSWTPGTSPTGSTP